MTTKKPPEFAKDEVILIQATLKQRYGHAADIELADAEIRLNPAMRASARSQGIHLISQ